MTEPGQNTLIARRAYEIWEAEGRPHGRDREHWEAAAQQLGTPAPVPEDYKTDEALPGLEAATKKPAARRKKTAPADGSVPAAEPKPARKRRTAAPAP